MMSRYSVSRLGLFAAALFLLLPSPPSAIAQSSTATLQGLITDSTGGVVPGADVTITNLATNLSRTFQTSETGIYSFPLLPVGRYRLDVTKTGFKSVSRDNIVLQVSDRVTLDLSLEIGGTTERINIEADAPLI